MSDFIIKMKAAGKLAKETLEYACSLAKPGISTEYIDSSVHDFILSRGAIPSPLNYCGFPKSTCISVNNTICHGVPDSYVLQKGDSVNIDITVTLDGHFGDTSRSFIVEGEDTTLIACAREATTKAISIIKPGITMGDLGFLINKFVTRKGFYVVESIGGHGIGTKFHMDPFTPSFGKKGKGLALKEGMCITVEPLIKDTPSPVKDLAIPGCSITRIDIDGRGAQFEHTVLVTKDGHEILTR